MKKITHMSLIAAAVVAVSIPALAYAATLTRSLELGSTGSDVSSLQTFLAQDPTIYPQGLVTGYFGSLTKSAVSNFQARNEIETVGRVGPVTLPIINYQMVNGMNGNGTIAGTVSQAPIISNVGVNVGRNDTTVSWYTNEAAKGVLYYSSSPLILSERPNAVDVTGASALMTDINLRTSQSIMAQNLQSNTTYYYIIYSTDQMGNVSVTWPSTFHTNN